MKKIDNLTTIILFAVFLLTLGIGGWMLRDQSFLKMKTDICSRNHRFRQRVFCQESLKRHSRIIKTINFPFGIAGLL